MAEAATRGHRSAGRGAGPVAAGQPGPIPHPQADLPMASEGSPQCLVEFPALLAEGLVGRVAIDARRGEDWRSPTSTSHRREAATHSWLVAPGPLVALPAAVAAAAIRTAIRSSAESLAGPPEDDRLQMAKDRLVWAASPRRCWSRSRLPGESPGWDRQETALRMAKRCLALGTRSDRERGVDRKHPEGWMAANPWLGR